VNDNYTFRWNLPAATNPTRRSGNEAFAITPDPMDEPIDVIIVVKDASAAAVSPAAPTLSPTPTTDDASKK
jgi:hypothetical protein